MKEDDAESKKHIHILVTLILVTLILVTLILVTLILLHKNAYYSDLGVQEKCYKITFLK